MCVFRIMNFFTLVIIFWTFFLCKIPILLGNNCFMNSLINMEIWLFHYICFIADSCFLLCTPASICYLPHIYRIINYLLNKAGWGPPVLFHSNAASSYIHDCSDNLPRHWFHHWYEYTCQKSFEWFRLHRCFIDDKYHL